MTSKPSAFETTLDNATATWDAVAKRLEEFILRWETDENGPPLDEFLPDSPAALRQLVLVGLVKVDLECQWKPPRKGKLVEQYAQDFPELVEEGVIPTDLIYEEYHVRKSVGDTEPIESYFKRFPHQESQLRRLFGLNAPAASTALFAKAVNTTFEPGEKLDDFLLLARLGKGAFGSVYLARQISMQRMVALKVSADKGTEAQTLAQMEHNHIVRVYDQRSLPQQRLRLLYMQYVPGGALQDVVDRVRQVPVSERTGKLIVETVDKTLADRGETPPVDSLNRKELERLNWPQAVCKLGAQLADALHHAHQNGVLHRDVKPANVLLAADATPKLADFNISFASQLDGASPAAYFGGSLAYMSPEQLEACNPNHDRQPEELDGRSDVYSLGVMLWELLYGERPYANEKVQGSWSATLAEMALRRREAPAKPPHDFRRNECWRQLQESLDRCLAPNAANRFEDASRLSHALWLCLQPRAQRILSPARHGWRAIIKRLPLFTFLMLVVLPHAFAAVFNLIFNKELIITPLAQTQPEVAERFMLTQGIINGVAFSVGIALISRYAWPVERALRKIRRREPIEQAEVSQARSTALRLAFAVTMLGVIEWTIAGLAFALGLRLTVTESLHFFLSLTLCGLVASAYPFFNTAVLAIRVFYPALLAASQGEINDEAALLRLSRQGRWMLVVAGAIPSLGVFILFLLGTNKPIVQMALAVFSLLGFVGVVVVYWVFMNIQRDIGALISAARPGERGGVASESISQLF